MKSWVILAAAALLVTSCATVPPQANPNYSLVDPKGVDMAKYQLDYQDCASLALQADVGNSAAAGGAVGAGAGAVIGAILGAVICGRNCAAQGAAFGAGAGVSQGAVSGAAAAAQDQQITLRNCLAGRGYRVIR